MANNIQEFDTEIQHQTEIITRQYSDTFKQHMFMFWGFINEEKGTKKPKIKENDRLKRVYQV